MGEGGEGGKELSRGHYVSPPEDEESNNVNVLNTTELYTPKWLKW